MAEDDPILAALGLKAPGADRHWSFQVSDIVLTAALLAGGADPIHKLMNAFRKFMEAFGEGEWHTDRLSGAAKEVAMSGSSA